MDVGVAYPYSQGGPRVLPVPRHGWAPWGWASSTCSAARIGAPTRRANATASLGRESTCTPRPSTRRTRGAGPGVMPQNRRGNRSTHCRERELGAMFTSVDRPDLWPGLLDIDTPDQAPAAEEIDAVDLVWDEAHLLREGDQLEVRLEEARARDERGHHPLEPAHDGM